MKMKTGKGKRKVARRLGLRERDPKQAMGRVRLSRPAAVAPSRPANLPVQPPGRGAEDESA
jgi:hypothetical protein